MKVIVDDKIPYIREAIERIADEVVYVPGKEFTPELVHDADALIIRTRTRCDQALLEGSRVRFIATATIGFDHIDTEYCRQAGITWTNAPGCNARSVQQYIESVLILLKQEEGMKLSELTIGVVGVGHVGTLVVELAEAYGMKVLRCDPPRALAEGDLPLALAEKGDGLPYFHSLSELMELCDLISFHVPLIREGAYPSYHLADDSFFAGLKKKPFIINTSRGEVVETAAIKRALDKGLIRNAVLDVWENEPHIDLELLNRIFIGTPHIAGYSADGKANATRMSLDALCHFFGIEASYQIKTPLPEHTEIHADADEATLLIYDPRRDCRALRLHPEDFERLRGNYPLRREREAYTIIC